ncbi:MAG: uL13 family ribosomal protein, partial [Holosporaceae bacterium]
MRTFSLKAGEMQRKWWLVDAADLVLGRLASQVALRLRGK